MKPILHKHTRIIRKSLLFILLIAAGWAFTHSGNALASSDIQVKIVKFYPNPATSYINFEFPANIDRTYSIAIYSFSGKKMEDVPVSSSKISIILSDDFYRGIYIFQLHDKNGKLVEAGKFQVAR
ncbi:MAG: T9SS type A sorting domain-containing protein [Bacteroidetes bacterium]|nr:T9SS type A sorting domain-containing protein [Bacteroidota bacterium]